MPGAFDDLLPASASKGAFADLLPAEPASTGSKVLKGMRDPLDASAQLLSHLLPQGVNDALDSSTNWLADRLPSIFSKIPEKAPGQTGVDALTRQQEQEYQARRTAGGESGFDAWRAGGNVVSPMNLLIASRLPVGGASLASRLGAGALGGGVSAALGSPVSEIDDYWSEKGKQAGVGAVGGALLAPVVGAVSRVISPNASTNPELALLKEGNVQPTIGQTLGGWANRTEEKLQSLPIVGDAITAARQRAREQLNAAAINRATEPVGARVQGAGTAAVDDAHQAVSQAYDKGKAMLGNFQIDAQAAGEFQQLRSMTMGLPDKERNAFNNILDAIKTDVNPNGSVVADGFKRIDSKLGKEAASFSGSSDAYQQKLGDAVKQLQSIFTDNAKRANPQAAQILADADQGFANLVRVEGASVGAKGTGGVFSPGQLLTAVRGADRSVRDNATARGQALMQDLASAGQSVLGNKVPNSGTADRLILGGGALLGGGAVNLGIPAALLGGAATYSPQVQSLLRMLASSRPQAAQPIADSLKKVAPYLLPASSQAGFGLLNQ